MSHIAETPLKFDANSAFSANKTFRIDFAVPIGPSATNKGVAKGDKYAGDGGGTNDQYLGLNASVVDAGGSAITQDLNLITRSVASSQVSRALGLNSVVAEAYAKTPDGKPIGVSAMASGTQMLTNVTDANGTPSATISRDFKFDRADIQKGLYDLEAVDYLTGQIDRHAGNIFINDETGEVQGIDNDLCFGEKELQLATRDNEISAKAAGAPPFFYHEDTAAAIERMQPAELVDILSKVNAPEGGRGLSEKEIGNAVDRLKTMQNHIQLARSEGRVVSQFDDKTFQASIAQQKAHGGEIIKGSPEHTGNYVGRSQIALDVAKADALEDDFYKIEAPGGARPLSAYEQQLQGLHQGVEQAKNQALAEPSDSLRPLLDQKENLLTQIKQHDDDIKAALADKTSLLNNLQLQSIAGQAFSKRIDDLLATTVCRFDANKADADPPQPQTTPTLTAGQATLIRTMVKTLSHVQEGDRLKRNEISQLASAAAHLERLHSRDMRQKELQQEIGFVRSAAPQVQAAKAEALTQLAELEKDIATQIQADPRVQQAVAAQQEFIQGAGKTALTEGRQAEIAAENEAALAAIQQEQKPRVDLIKKAAESNKVSLESLNLMKDGVLKTEGQLRSAAIGAQDDAAGAKLAGDQMADVIDHAGLDEGEAMALDGTLGKLGLGSDLEVSKMYAHSAELRALAEVQTQFIPISKAMEAGEEPTQEQQESFGAAVQAFSECEAKTRAATIAVNESITSRLHEKIEAKVGPLLDEQGFSPEEKAATLQAITSVATDIDIMKLRDTDERTELYANEVAEGISNSSFDYPGGSKVHQALYRAFDATAVKDADGSLAVKPAGGGQTFNEKTANKHIDQALAAQGLPPAALMKGQERDNALNSQLEAGETRSAIYLAKQVAADAAKAAQKAEKTAAAVKQASKDAELAPLKRQLERLEAQKEHLQNHAGPGDKLKALLKYGTKGTNAEIAKLDKEIAATRESIAAIRDDKSLDQQRAQLDQKQQDLQASNQQLDQLKAAEKTLGKAVLTAAMDDMGISGLSDQERDALVKKANQAINVREALKGQEPTLRQHNADLKAEAKQTAKAINVREKLGRTQPASDIGSHRGGHGV